MSKMKKTSRKLICAFLSVLLLIIVAIPINAAESKVDKEVLLGGCLFGLKMQTDGVPIVGIDKVETEIGAKAPAYDAGIKLKDIIIKINGKTVSSVKEVVEQIHKSNGTALQFTVRRNGEELVFSVVPQKGVDGIYHAGIWIRDSAAGIGTITYIDPKTNEFGGLGHGICDSDTASLLPISRGTVTDVELQGVVKGQNGIPGEIKGAFKGGKIGSLVKNSNFGVYGVYGILPNGITEVIKVAKSDEAREGKAMIRCSVTGTAVDYEIEITKITHKSEDGKNYTIRVTDPALLKITGGIVQGMSGSPIIQNGKLIGAVTHVTVNDPTKGYGIFIGNMLNATNTPITKAS